MEKVTLSSTVIMAYTFFSLFFALTLAASAAARFLIPDGCSIFPAGGPQNECGGRHVAMLNEMQLTEGQLNHSKAFFTKLEPTWPLGLVPYVIDEPAFDSAEITNMKKAMSHIECRSGGCVRFRKRTSQNDYVKIVRGPGCTSFVGRIGGEQEISLGVGCTLVTFILHEFLHAIGFQHEHQRPDRDDYIIVHKENVESGAESQFDKFQDTVGFKSRTYDFLSLMHYDMTEFSKNGLRTMEPISGANWKRICEKNGMSVEDTKMVKKEYCCVNFFGISLPCTLL